MSANIVKRVLLGTLCLLVALLPPIMAPAHALDADSPQPPGTGNSGASPASSPRAGGSLEERAHRTHQASVLARKAQTFLDSGNYSKAKEIYQQSCKFDPNDISASIHTNYAVTLQNLGDNDGAIAENLRAIDFNGDAEVPLFNLGICYMEAEKLPQAAGCFSRLIREYPDSCHISAAKSLLKKIQMELSSAFAKPASSSDQAASRSGDDAGELTAGSSNEPSAGAGGSSFSPPPAQMASAHIALDSQAQSVQPTAENKQAQSPKADAGGKASNADESRSDYLKNVTVHGVCRWPAKALPIKVYIAPGAGVRGYKESFRNYMIRSFDEWMRASGYKLSWRLVEKESDADLACSWISKKSEFKMNGFGEQGEAYLNTAAPNANNERTIRSATIQICTVNLFGIVPLRGSEVLSVCRHEIGHALGLDGHLPHLTDVMYPAQFGVVIFPIPVTISAEMRITSRDAATISHLYAAYPRQAAGRRN